MLLGHLSAALVAGGLIGLDRSHHGRPAGLSHTPRATFEYRMTIRTPDPANARRLARSSNGLGSIGAFRIQPTGD
jgi:hypothetical protein